MWPALVLLDRDGVINADSPDAILTPDQWQPLPGSLKALARFETPASEAVFIGDSARDLQAAEAAGVPAWLVRTSNGQEATARDAAFAHVPVFDNLVTAVGALTAPRAAVGEPL
ncbi:MAG: HAD hydrolase-like protein [Spiribacter sp.]|nr:HAD hydrolase-like protein [Spiribacter sp.]